MHSDADYAPYYVRRTQEETLHHYMPADLTDRTQERYSNSSRHLSWALGFDFSMLMFPLGTVSMTSANQRNRAIEYLYVEHRILLLSAIIPHLLDHHQPWLSGISTSTSCQASYSSRGDIRTSSLSSRLRPIHSIRKADILERNVETWVNL